AIVLAFFAGSVLLRPRPASAASKLPQFAFPPVFGRKDQAVGFSFFNTNQRRTPTGSVVFLHADGSQIASEPFPSVPAAGSCIVLVPLAADSLVSVVANIDTPQIGQARPHSLPAAVAVYGAAANGVQAVIVPAS